MEYQRRSGVQCVYRTKMFPQKAFIVAVLLVIIFIPQRITWTEVAVEKPVLKNLIKEHSNHPRLTLSIAFVESSLNPNAISSKGAMGLMQVMPLWEDLLIKKGIIRRLDDLFDPILNIRAGEFILAHYKKQTKGNLKKALWLYSNRDDAYPNKVLKKMEDL